MHIRLVWINFTKMNHKKDKDLIIFDFYLSETDSFRFKSILQQYETTNQNCILCEYKSDWNSFVLKKKKSVYLAQKHEES